MKRHQGILFYNLVGLFIFLAIGVATGWTTFEDTQKMGKAFYQGLLAFIGAVILCNLIVVRWPLVTSMKMKRKRMTPEQIEEERIAALAAFDAMPPNEQYTIMSQHPRYCYAKAWVERAKIAMQTQEDKLGKDD